MKRLYCLGAALLLVLFFEQHAAQAQRPGRGVSCSLAEDALKAASGIRKLAILQKVPCHIQSKEQVDEYLSEVITRDVPKTRIDQEGNVSRILGLIPQSFNYYQGLVALYTEQLAGYYDPDGHFYAMADWIPVTLQSSIAVHELTHALQDQHFNLARFTDETKLSNDEIMARSALVEGDAMAVMMDYERSRQHLPPLERLTNVDGLVASELIGAAIGNASSGTPKTLEALLMFPYVSGLRFVHGILRRGGHSAVDAAFLIPPQSTEQILHPEQFLVRREHAGFEVLEDPPADMPEFEMLEPVFTDSLGEFTIEILLSQWIPPARAAEAGWGWGGDRLSFYENPETKKFLLLWHSRWDTLKDAREFFSGTADGYEERFKEKDKMPRHIVVHEEKRIQFRDSPAGDILMTLEGRDVMIRIYGTQASQTVL